MLCIRVSTINNVKKSTNYTRRLSVILAKKKFTKRQLRPGNAHVDAADGHDHAREEAPKDQPEVSPGNKILYLSVRIISFSILAMKVTS